MKRIREQRPGLLCRLVLLFIGAGLILPGLANSTEENSATDTSLRAFVPETWRDLSSLLSSDNAWWLVAGTVLTISVRQFEDADGVAMTLDQGALDSVSDFGNIWGDLRVQVPLALGAWALGGTADNSEIAALGFDLSRGLFLSYVTVTGIKLGVNRTRPNGEDYSFPSGHTAAAFTTAGVISRRYGGWAGGAAVGLGVTTAMGRMEDFKHFASDVVAGATIGWIMGRHAARPERTGGLTWQWVPTGSGVAIAGRF